MNNNILLSIIVPVYNCERYIQRCIQSILSQTFRDFELIIIDDGSSDNSLSYSRELALADERVCLINVKRGGVSKARNIGLDKACGKWVLFVDADDYLCPSHLQNYINNLDADLIYQGYRLFSDSDGSTIEIKQQPALYANDVSGCMDILHRLFAYGNFFGPTWNKLFRRSIISKYHLHFDEAICFREDELFTFEYCQYISSIRVLSTTTYNYRETPGSLMRRYNDPEMLYEVVNKSYEASLQLPVTTPFRLLIEKYYSNSLVYIGRMAYNQRHLKTRRFRLHILSCIANRRKEYRTPSTNRFILLNAVISDYYYLLRYFTKYLLSKLLMR